MEPAGDSRGRVLSAGPAAAVSPLGQGGWGCARSRFFPEP